MSYHTIAGMLRVDRSDDCIWLVDERGPAQSVHMTPDQATSVGEALLEAGGSSSDSLSLPIDDGIVGDVVAGLMDKWRLDEDQKQDLVKLSQARDKIQPSAEVYAAIADRSTKNRLQASVMLIEKHIENAEKAVRKGDEAKAEMSRGLARKKIMGLVETLAAQRQLSGYTNGLTEAHRLLAVA